MRAAGNLAGVEFVAPPRYHHLTDEWKEVITESGYWFSKDAMRYFATRVSWDSLTKSGPDSYLFISSEQDTTNYSAAAWDGRRQYSVREWRPEHGVLPISEFGEYKTLNAAKAALKQHLTNTLEKETN
jgi:hypothetical protein